MEGNWQKCPSSAIQDIVLVGEKRVFECRSGNDNGKIIGAIHLTLRGTRFLILKTIDAQSDGEETTGMLCTVALWSPS